MAKILIVGAGDVGGRLACALAADGHDVMALRRSTAALPGVHMIQADVTRPETLQLPAGLAVVVTALSPGESGVDAYRRVYVDGTHSLQQALAGQQLLRQFWVSSTSVYGEHQGEWVDEDTPAQPASATAQALLDAEALVMTGAWPGTIVRFGGLYGPGRHRLLRWVESGRTVQAEPPSWSNRMHVEDAAGLLRHLVTRALAGAPVAPLYLGVDNAPSPQHEVLAWLAAQMQLAAPAGERREGAGAGKRIRNRALQASGYVLRYPDYRAGYAHVLAEARNVQSSGDGRLVGL